MTQQKKTEPPAATQAPSEATAALIHWERQVNEMASGVSAKPGINQQKTNP